MTSGLISHMFSKRSGIVCRVNLLPTSVSSLVSAVLAKFRGNGCMTCKVIEEGDPGIERAACATSFPSSAFFNCLRVLGLHVRPERLVIRFLHEISPIRFRHPPPPMVSTSTARFHVSVWGSDNMLG